MNNDVSIRYRWGGCFVLALLLAFALTGVTYAESDDPAVAHKREYEAAMDMVLDGPYRIREEMRRILQGDVAHYDFLQYEHIELIRHARALAHPPAALDEADRKDIAALAGDVVEATNELEWIIADFLRVRALHEIHEKNPENTTVGARPDSLLQKLDGAPVVEAALALQRRYEAAYRSG